MNILMLTNTFTPHVGGVARSVETFVAEFRARGHRVIVIAPEFEDMPESEADVIRVPALRKFNGSDFSVRLPIPGYMHDVMDSFGPQIIHSHHPFMLGATALRLASHYDLPIVFTHHTMYERYTHYVPLDSAAMKKFVIKLSTGFANLCDAVIAPSESIGEIIRERGVETPIHAIPTGIDLDRFGSQGGKGFRSAMRIPPDGFLIGHVGRLAPEKNLEFLAEAVASYMRRDQTSHFLVVGQGPSKERMQAIFREAGLSDRLHFAGVLGDPLLPSAYASFDVFAFASESETQGMVLAEAMASRVPVVALDAPGAREVVRDGVNGRLLMEPTHDGFADALGWVAGRVDDEREGLKKAAGKTAQEFSIDVCAGRVLEVYKGLLKGRRPNKPVEDSLWDTAVNMIATEWEMISYKIGAAGAAISPFDVEPEKPE